MAEFEALGRDVVATADSTFDPAAAGALKALWRWAGFEEGENPNHLWTVTVDAQSDRFSVSAAVKKGNVYVAPPHPDSPATVEELARSQGEALALGVITPEEALKEGALPVTPSKSDG